MKQYCLEILWQKSDLCSVSAMIMEFPNPLPQSRLQKIISSKLKTTKKYLYSFYIHEVLNIFVNGHTAKPCSYSQ